MRLYRVVRGDRQQFASADLESAFARQFGAQQQAKKCRFARAAWAGEENKIAFVDGQRQIVQRIDAAAVELREVIGLYHAACAPTGLCSFWKMAMKECDYNMRARLNSSLTRFGLAFPLAAFIT